MSTRREHYKAAEQILAEGEREILVIRTLKASRDVVNSSDDYESLTHQMDEAGKKAMGCWAQAQVHATLATASETVADA